MINFTPQESYVLIGNGFDIECGLSTKYTDYLSYLLCVHNILEKPEIRNDTKEITDLCTHHLVGLKQEIIQYLIDNSDKLGIWKPAIKSFWNLHFQNVSLRGREKWIDFENEISKVTRLIEENMTAQDGRRLEGDDQVLLDENYGTYDVIKRILDKCECECVGIGKTRYNITYQDLSKKLFDELNAFINGFDMYLRNCVALIKPKNTANIKTLIDKLRSSFKPRVISFNYTDTFESILKQENINAEFCYVHGRVGSDNTPNTMVLGINEHLDETELRKNIVFAPFRKYYQRILKGTDSDYMDWIPEGQKQTLTDKELTIFGHSLGISDGDILKRFISCPRMYTTIYYHSINSFSLQVGNMTAIIGKNEMIHRTGGKYHTMEFVKQA